MSMERAKPQIEDGRTSRRRRDAGVTLPEIIVSIVLIGTIVAALASSAIVVIRSSSTSYDIGQLTTMMRNASDKIDRAPQQCNYDAYVEAAATATDWPASTVSASVEMLTGSTGTTADWTPQSCLVDVGPFDVQRITITGSTPDGRVTQTLTVVKSDVD